MSKDGRIKRINLRGAIYPRNVVKTLEEKIAKAIYEAKYPDSDFERLHVNRNVRKQRLVEAAAVVNLLETEKIL